MQTNQTEYVDKVRGRYAEKQSTKLDELKALDKKVKTPAVATAYVLGVIAALVLGTGMCLALEVIGNMFVLGVVIGCVGIALCIANYFIYEAILRSRKKKYGSQIIALSDELLNKQA